MAQNNIASNISARAKRIVDSFIYEDSLNPIRAKYLIVSLYARRAGAKKEIVSRLIDESMEIYSVCFTQEAFAILDAEYNEVVKSCHNFIKGIERYMLDAEDNIHFPDELVDLCTRIIGSKETDTVFFPYAGCCDVAFSMSAKRLTGFDVNQEVIDFNQILFEAYGIPAEVQLCAEVLPILDTTQLYDHILAFHPRLSAKLNRQVAQYYLTLLEKGLCYGGNMCLILPLGELSSLHWTSFRRYLVDNKENYNVLTISLPAIFMPFTGVKYSLMLIEKVANPDGSFSFMEADGEKFFTNRRQPKIKTDLILESIRMCDERHIRKVDVEEYSFVPSRYFVYDNLPKLDDGFDYFTLGQLARILEVPGWEGDIIESVGLPGRYVRFSSLNDNYMSCAIDYKDITPAPIPSSAYEAYANGGYAAFVNGRIKVGQISGAYSESGRFVESDPYSNSPFVIVDGSVAHFAPRENGQAQLDYILRELMSDYVLEQAKKLAYGTVKQEMRHNDFFKLKIAVPSIERQDEILKQDRIDAVEKAGVKLDELNEKFRRDIHMMLHGLGQTVFNLGNWMKMLNYARKTGNGIIDEKAEIGGLVKVKGSEIFDNIDTALSVLSRQISTFDAGYRMKSTKFSLTEFLDKYIEMHKRPNVDYDFSSASHRAENDVPLVDIDDTDPQSIKAVEYPGEYLLRKGDVMDYIDFSEEALQIILDCIVTNAVAHGFTNPEKKYVIRMDFEAQGSNYVLSVSNNGDPLPAGKKPEEVFIWGETTGGKTHAGIGGYQIRNLMEEFGGTVELISTPDDEFTVTYKLTFTKTNLMEVDL